MRFSDLQEYPIQPDTLRVIYEYHCGECTTLCREEWIGADPPMPTGPPEGWKQVEPGRWLCPEHAK